MYKPVPYLLAVVSSSFIFLWSNERLLQSDWRELLSSEIKMAAPLRFHDKNVIVRPHGNNTGAQGTNARDDSSSSSTQILDIQRLSGLRNTTPAKYSPYMHPTSRPKMIRNRPDCSCEKEMDGYFCCQRAILVVHKMGVTAVQSWRDQHLRPTMRRYVPTAEITSHTDLGASFLQTYANPQFGDYRQVVVTRNWYDALISGYLYHKSGKECWLDWFGRPNHQGWLLQNEHEDWEQRLLHPQPVVSLTNNLFYYYRSFNMSWNPGNERDLCRYLNDETEEMGLRVYIAWAMDIYMYPLLDFQKRRRQYETQNGRNLTKYVCFEQFTNPGTQSGVFHDMAHWLFPNRNVTFNMSKTSAVTADKQQTDHASNQDHQLRERMLALIRKLDTEIFARAIEKGNSQFGCGSKENEASLM